MTVRLAVLVGLGALAVACNGGSGSPAPDSLAPAAPSPMTAQPEPQPANPTSVTTQSRQGRNVNMMDACDPETFNAVVGPGTCTRSGGLTFQLFIDALTRQGFVGAWHFAPNTTNVRVGQTFVAVNRGGEVHTFTEVAKFGGGIVPDLNQLAHVPDVAPECASLDPDDFVAPGGEYSETVDHSGTVKFQCCIHPWMKLEAQDR
jgi:plastocyanin